MISAYTILVLIFYLQLISTIFIVTYKNASFNPFNNHSIIYNFSSIQSREICICQCLMNSICKTVTYNGYYQYCVLYSDYLQEGQLQLMTTNVNSSVISLSNMFYTGPTSSSVVTTERISTQVTSQAGTTAIETSSSPTISTMITTLVTTPIATTAVATCTTLVTFDDISNQSSTSGIIPNGYKNLDWINAEYINASVMSANSGYKTAVRSPWFVMDNPTGGNVTITTANGTRFSFDSLYLTSAWRDSLNVTMKTIRAGSITTSGLYTAMTSYATYIYCSFCTNIDTVTLQAQGGIPHANFTQNGTQFIIDNLCISFEY